MLALLRIVAYVLAVMSEQLTHRRSSNDNETGHVMLFCDSERNSHYGRHVWTLKTDLPSVPQSVIEFAAEFFGVDQTEAKELVNPENIVDSSGAWDDPQFASDVYQLCGEPVGFRTPDGAVVLDRYDVNLEYTLED